jgi:hypothetical protein
MITVGIRQLRQEASELVRKVREEGRGSSNHLPGQAGGAAHPSRTCFC